MADYYSILGVSRQATATEIKAAFRRLAKQYHPDKNPEIPHAKELFNSILKAYETLSDPVKKRRYDLYYSSGGSDVLQTTTAQQRRAKRQKEWTFTEEDVKKRQYYQQYYKQAQKSVNTETVSKSYSDYKYVLYATPIAVCLLMLIISLFTPGPGTVDPEKTAAAAPPAEASVPRPATGDQVYSGYFGPIQTAETSYKLSLSNASGDDAVVAIFNHKTDRYLRHAYVENGYYVEFSGLPKEGVYLRCMMGKHWDPRRVVYKNQVQGCFDSIVQYQDWRSLPVSFNQTTGLEMIRLQVLPGQAGHGVIASESDFFRKSP